MRTILCLACVWLVLTPASGHAQSTPKKLIEFGWDEPDTSFLRAHLATLEQTPFDGCVFHVDGKDAAGKAISLTWNGWGKTRINEDDVRAARDDLKALRPKRFTSNFLRFNTAPADIDWFDDHSSVLANARLAASLARDGRCAGILLDTEQYQGHLFRYKTQRDAKSKDWQVYKTKVHQRGHELMTAFQEEYPDLVVMVTFGHTMAWRNMKRGAKSLADAEYGLLAPFLDGMIAATKGKTKIVDGYELAYGFKQREQFVAARKTIDEDVMPIVADAETYRRVVTAGFGLWLDFDWREKGWNTDDPSKNYFTPDAFETSVKHALEVAPEYVWIYSETPRWWSASGKSVKLPEAYDQALRRARTAVTLPRKPE